MPAPNLRAFAEKVAVVTDAGNPFGRAVALQLALEGCYVIGGYADESIDNTNALNELQALGTLASAVNVDVATAAGVATLFETVAATYGRLDLLVNTARIQSETDFAKIGQNDFDRNLNHNLRAAFFCAQAAVPLMRNRSAAAIVNLTQENRINALDCATFAATVGLTGALAEELAPKIRVNAVSIQAAKTEPPPPTFELLRAASAVAPDDVARTALYLLSPEAAAITGQIISVGAKRARL